MPPQQAVRRTARRGTLAIAAFWLGALGLLYLGFNRLEGHRAEQLRPRVTASGELLIPRQPDGHFHVEGQVNGHPVRFLVDTGASQVTVTEAFARAAGLEGGQAVTFRTANGPMPGRIVRGVGVSAGPMHLPDVSVAVGLNGHDRAEALLGQSFLSRFDLELTADHMVLRVRR